MADITKYIVGGKDAHGLTITLIHEHNDAYIIYESTGLNLHHDEVNPASPCSKKLSKISSKMAIISFLAAPSDKQLVNKQVAEAWKLCFNDEIENSIQTLDSLIAKLMVKGKINYFMSALCAFILVIIVGTVLYLSWYEVSEYNEKFKINKFAMLGAIGGFISILIKLNTIVLDPNSNKLNIISGASRIAISATSAVIFYLGYRANLLLAIFEDGQANEIYFLYFFAFIAGFAEMFIPDIADGANKILKFKEGN